MIIQGNPFINLFKSYPSYEEREEAKTIGWGIISKSDSIAEKTWYFLHCIIWSHYWRAREDLEGRRLSKTILRKIRGKKYYKGYILDIDHYTRHWLWANKESVSPEVLDCLKSNWGYEAEESKLLPRDYTQYQYFPSQN